MKLEVGDWVTNSEGFLFQVREDILFAKDDFTKWQPKEGEWCWFRSESMPKYIQVLAQFKELTDNDFAGKYSIIFNPDDVEEGVVSINYDECEPFIGELPSFTKDKE